MGREVGLVGAERVHHAEGGHEAAEGPEDAEVGGSAAFGVRVTVGVGGDAARGCEGGGDVAQG